MDIIIILGLIITLIWALNRNPLDHPRTKSKIYQLNQQWVDFVAGYFNVAGNDAEKSIIWRMLGDLRQQGMPISRIPLVETVPEPPRSSKTVVGASIADGSVVTQPSAQPVYAPYYTPPQAIKQSLDNATILLYFGAFLLVAAAGLFVAFGGASGGVRTFITSIVAAFIYCGGFWLWYSKPKLKQAALTFIGIGIVLVPLAGLAAYSYVWQDAGRAVWLVTSLVCLAVYSHALWVLKNPLLEYVLIGTFVSLFESAVAILHAPVYYFGWGLAVVGLLVQAVQILRRGKPEYDQPSTVSSNVLVPLSLLVALFMIPNHGTAQLGVSLLLASLYYGLLAWRSTEQSREGGFVASQSLFLCSIAIFAYSINDAFSDAAIALVALALPQLAWILLRKGQIVTNGASVMLSSLVASVLLASRSPSLQLVAALVLALSGVMVWLRQFRNGAYQLSCAALAAVILIFAYRTVVAIEPPQIAATLLLALAAAQLLVFYWFRNGSRDGNVWRFGFRAVYVCTLALALIFAFMTTPILLAVLSSIAAALMTPLVIHDDRSLWSTFSGLAVAIPLLGVFDKPALFLIVTFIALAWNTAFSWWLDTENNRAFGVVLWLLAPLSLSHACPGVAINGYYAIAYSIIVVILLCMRSLALSKPRKIVNLPISAGSTYVVGYVAASAIAVFSSTAGPRFLPAIVSAIVALAMYVASVYVEKRADIIIVVPILAQIGLWMTYQYGQMMPYLLLSAAFALFGYGAYRIMPRPESGSRGYYMQLVSLFAMFVPVAMYLGGNVWWPMPWAFLMASLAVMDYVWTRGQSARELSGGLILLSVFALMHFYGVRNVQAYAHVAALLGAAYAYWRASRGETEQSDQYVVVTLATVTIPLVIQALAGTAGDLYGWWLLIEQIVIMLLGMLIGKKIMVRWGLYVALGSVLYQLRNLGWAALAVVAVFLIGLGVYYLQKMDNKPSDEHPGDQPKY